uniref:Uncharacterized protein n=1 Tax=Anguilla anguilla TaxID=7936 RepID=A0A0E9TY76_ANGAN
MFLCPQTTQSASMRCT